MTELNERLPTPILLLLAATLVSVVAGWIPNDALWIKLVGLVIGVTMFVVAIVFLIRGQNRRSRGE